MRVLFVDDDPSILQGLQRLLRAMRNEWDMSFAQGAREAIELFDQSPFDVIVTDMRMPETTGLELLTSIRDKYPATARIILSGHSDVDSAVRTAGIAHRFLAKPCDADVLRGTIHRVTSLRRLLHSPQVIGVVSSLGKLPSLPSSYEAIERALQSDEPSLSRVAQIISKDIAMSAKVLQLINSAFFGLARRVESIEQAVTLLGIDIIRALVLSNSAFALFHPAATRFSAETLWQHSLRVGSIASRIAKAESADRVAVGQALQAGIMHDLGQLVLATQLPQAYDEALRVAAATGMSIVEAERTTVGATHPEVGAYLLGLWGLPDSTVEAVAFHHSPSAAETRVFSPLAAVHAANALVADAAGAAQGPAGQDETFLQAIGAADRWDAWREIAQEMLCGAAAS